MNLIESQIKFSRELFELNTNALRQLVALTTEENKRLLEMGREFGSRLPEVKDVTSFVELQREYAQQLWSGAQESFKTRGELLRETVEQAGTTFRDAFQPEETQQEAA